MLRFCGPKKVLHQGIGWAGGRLDSCVGIFGYLEDEIIDADLCIKASVATPLKFFRKAHTRTCSHRLINTLFGFDQFLLFLYAFWGKPLTRPGPFCQVESSSSLACCHYLPFEDIFVNGRLPCRVDDACCCYCPDLKIEKDIDALVERTRGNDDDGSTASLVCVSHFRILSFRY